VKERVGLGGAAGVASLTPGLLQDCRIYQRAVLQRAVVKQQALFVKVLERVVKERAIKCAFAQRGTAHGRFVGVASVSEITRNRRNDRRAERP